MKIGTTALRVCGAIALLLLAMPLMAQNPTGELTGRVTDSDGGVLPGVTVTATSPAAQGARTAVTGANGDYKIPFLPPGDYSVTYTLDGFQTTAREVKISAAQTTPSNVQLQIGEMTEEIVVTSQQAVISETQTVATTITHDEIENLPVARDISNAVRLAPGVTNSGFRSSTPVMAGAPSFENLYLVNGVVINENVRAAILDLFIEDAILETTTSISSVSAEYGRFTGGVVNAITKSGGNRFDGSLRVNLSNEDWISRTPLTTGVKPDDVNEVYEGTLGGYFMKDHLWFFGAGRDRSESGEAQTDFTNIAYPTTAEETRTELKLTVSPTTSHTVIGTYLEIDETNTNTDFGTILDLRSLNPQRGDPQEIQSVNYTGVLSSSFFVEGQWSQRDYNIGVGSGGPRDLIEGTLIRTQGEGFRYWAPTFCGECPNEERNNENLLVKGSYFLSTEGAGSHDLVFGYDTFEDIRFVINHQTGSDFTVYGSDVLRDAAGDPVIDPASGSAVPIFDPAAATPPWIRWFAVFNEDLAQPTAFKTNSFYVNDSWQLNDRWSFNLGVRYDENDGTDSSGAKVADDNKIAPRLGASWDVQGDGDLILRASYGTYVAGLNQQADDASPGGAIGTFRYTYDGAPVNVGCTLGVDCLTADDVLREVFAWYESLGGVYDLALFDPNAPIQERINLASIPGATSQIRGGVKSPAVDEITLGVTKRLGSRGLVRADLVLRDWNDFYGAKKDTETGQVPTESGPADLTLLGNFDTGITREYTGFLTQFRYRVTDRLNVAVNYTWSKLDGNEENEGVNTAANYSEINVFPEYKEASWNYPTGPLAADQRHTLRAWASYDVVDTDRHKLNVTWLENFFSGNPYEPTFSINPRNYVDNPGYLIPPSSVTYFPEGRGTYTTDDVHRTDLSVNYSFYLNVGNRRFEVFVQPEMLNVFNEDAVDNPSTSARLLQAFDPFNETPVEDVHWEKRTSFGTPTNESSFQAPREFRLSVGFRF